jgi:DNA-binding FrmR family transcriptional regulator
VFFIKYLTINNLSKFHVNHDFELLGNNDGHRLMSLRGGTTKQSSALRAAVVVSAGSLAEDPAYICKVATQLAAAQGPLRETLRKLDDGHRLTSLRGGTTKQSSALRAAVVVSAGSLAEDPAYICKVATQLAAAQGPLRETLRKLEIELPKFEITTTPHPQNYNTHHP